MYLSQLKKGGVICRVGSDAKKVNGIATIYQLATLAIQKKITLETAVNQQGFTASVDLLALAEQNLLDCPVRHPDPAHMLLTGTGLTHLGSASTRNAMHAKSEENLSDSMKIFQMGVEGGKPAAGEVGVQPEWFYKGTGVAAMASGDPLLSPSFALDGGEEPEIAGFYIIGEDGQPYRLGFALANEFSDHVTERINYLFLAHSKLRNASFGPELRLGDFPQDIRGMSRIVRDGSVLWEKEFLSGEQNMSHSIRNLEHHHFKYGLFRQPGDLHVHMFGTATLSFADNIAAQEGDVFEIEAPEFGLPLRNPMKIEDSQSVEVLPL